MRAVVTRVTRASVSVAGEEIAAIGPGMLVLLGVGREDGPAEADAMVARLRALRIFPGPDGRMNEPVGAREVLCVSQFTLLADTRKGSRPSFSAAAPAEVARPLYVRVCEGLDARMGAFGAEMEVFSGNDGPVTVVLDS